MQLPEQPHSPGTGSSVEISIRLDHTQVLRMIQERFIDWHHRASASSWKGSAWLVILITRPFQHSGKELPLRVCRKPQLPAAAALALAREETTHWQAGNCPRTSSQLWNHLCSTEMLLQKEEDGSRKNPEHGWRGISFAWHCLQRLDRGQTPTLLWYQWYYLSQGQNASVPFTRYGSLTATQGFLFHRSQSIFMGNRAHSLRSLRKIAFLTQGQEYLDDI